MSAVAFTLAIIAAIAYLVASILFVMHLADRERSFERPGLMILAAGLVVHGVSKAARMLELGHVPVADSLEALNLLALIIGIVFLLVARKYAVPALGAFAAPVLLVTLTASLVFGGPRGPIPEALRSLWFPIHLGFAITADAFFAIAGLASMAYLIQERFLQQKNLGSVFRRLPPLHVLDEICHRLIVLGWASLTVGIAAGSIFAKQKWGAYWSWDPKQTWSLVTWLLFAGILHARITIGWQGRRTAWVTIGAVVLVLLSFVGLEAVFASRHTGLYQ